MTGTELPSGPVETTLLRIGQPGRLLDRKRIHVGPKEHRGAFAVAQHPHYPGSPYVFVDFVAAIP
jgi:hypothetical protein